MSLPSYSHPANAGSRPPDRSGANRSGELISAEELVGPEWAEWYSMTPAERWEASQRLFAEYVEMGGSIEPEVDTQSPFWSDDDLREFARHRPIDSIARRDGRSGSDG